MAQLQFDANAVPADERSFDPLPPGNYLVQVINSEMRVPRSGQGEMLTLTLQVLDGPYTNRLLWDNLNIVHSSEEAQRIANRALADLMLLVGLNHIADSEELHFKPFRARVGIREDKTGQYGPQNTIRYQQPKLPGTPPPPTRAPAPMAQQRAAAPVQQQQRPAPQQQAPAPRQNGNSKPWQKPRGEAQPS